MAIDGDSEPAGVQYSKRDRRIMVAAALAPMVFVLALVCLMVWTINNMFTQPPASVEHTPLMPDARNVSTQQTSNPDGKVITYQTATKSADVYKFYKDLLAKDGWGGKGYFSKPKLTAGGMIFEWYQSGPNGCEELGYTLHLAAEQTDPDHRREAGACQNQPM